MGFRNRAAIGAVASLYAAGASAATASFCTGSSEDVCFQWGVPEAAASSGSGNVYFQIRAPTEYQWVGLGIGQRMQGAEIYLMYQDGNGNVTLSTRQGRGHVMPEQVDREDVELLQGSGVANGEMVANVRCGSCDSLDLTSSNNWISAWRQGESLASSSTSEGIQVHDSHAGFEVDFAEASISSDENPFVTSNDDGQDGNGDVSPPPDNDGGSAEEGESGSGSGSGSGNGVTETGSSSNTDTLVRAHGIIMTIVFVAAYPLGALLMPVLHRWWLHAAWQSIAFLLMWAGFGLGYVAADRDGYWWNQAHTRLGTVVVAFLGIQPFLGFMHHWHYKKHQTRGIVSHVHIWYGRIFMIFGIVNGGLGLELAGSSRGYIIAYSVVAGICSLLYVGATFARRAPLARRQSKESHASAREEYAERA